MNPSLTPSLRAQQEALLDALFFSSGWESSADSSPWSSHPQNHRGMQAYQTNGHAMAERSLRAAYPVIEMMLGSTSFASLARNLWHRHPPERGDLAQWGGALPEFLATSDQLADTPYLADVARVEWAQHLAASAADALPDPASFARLAAEDPMALALTLAPGTALVTSRFPVASLVLAHLHQDPPLSEVAQRLREGASETALVWRQGLRPCIARCAPAPARLMQALLAGENVSASLDAALNGPALPGEAPFDFSAWLHEAVALGQVMGVHSVIPVSLVRETS